MEYIQSGPLARVERAIKSPGVPKRRSTVVRFMEKVKVEPGADACWEWQGSKKAAGYGYFRYPDGKYAHRFSYETFVGPIPEGLHLDHLCRNPPCVKPDHLEAVTMALNIQRSESDAYWTACDRWHPDVPTKLVQKRTKNHPECVECHRYRELNRRGGPVERPPGAPKPAPGAKRRALFAANQAKAPEGSFE